MKVKKYIITIIMLIVLINPALAIDIPDSRDLVADLKLRSNEYLTAIDSATGYRSTLIAYDKYQQFLESELNNSYISLLGSLPKDRKEQLKKSQMKWEEFRTNEFDFINNQWSRNTYGSSSAISRGGFKCSMIEARLIQLLHYRTNQ